MQECHRASAGAAAFVLLLFIAAPAFSASVLVPTMELITHGEAVAESFQLQTYGNVALSVEGGYKFGGSISFGLSHELSLENLDGPPIALEFLSAGMTFRDVFSLPVNLSYFVGANDVLCSGDGFSQFGLAPIMTAYRGFLAFPTGPMYDGIYQVWGTGLHVQWIPKVETASLDVYVYEDTHHGYPGNAAPLIATLGDYSADLRFLLNFSGVKMEGFLGATLVTGATQSGLYRAGFLFYAADRNVEFLAQIGIPLWNPLLDPALNAFLLYLLVEPRLHLGIVSIVPTFFWHPGGYMQSVNPAEGGTFDVNLNIFAGDLSASPLQGGLESNLRFQSSSGQLQAKVSPWIGFATPGILWTVKVSARLLPYNLSDMLEAFVGVRAEL